jgi:hypothetical protein
VRDSGLTTSVVVFRRFLLLPEASLFNTPDPADPSNYIESFVTATGRTTRGRGSSYALSSRAAGKAPAIPQKRVSKGSKMGSNRSDVMRTVIRVTRRRTTR